MISRRSILIGLLGSIIAGGAHATPGAVYSNGCHGRPRHCHLPSVVSVDRKGHRYVKFGDDSGRLRSNRRKRRER